MGIVRDSVSLRSVLADNAEGSGHVTPSITFQDLAYERSFFGTSNMTDNQSTRIRLDLDVDFTKIRESNIIGYKVSFQGNLIGKTETFDNFFLEDFHEKVHIGENDFDSLESLVLEPRTAFVTALDEIGEASDRNNGIVDDSELKAFHDQNMLFTANDLISDSFHSSFSLGLTPMSMDNLLADLSPYSTEHYQIRSLGDSGTNGSSLPVFKSDGGLKHPVTLREAREEQDTQDSSTSIVMNRGDFVANIFEETQARKREVDLGRIIKYVGTTYRSSRIFELSNKTFSFAGEVLMTIYPILDLPDDSNNEVESLGDPERYTLSFSDDINLYKKDFDGEKCQVRVVSNTPGKIIAQVTKSDFYANTFTLQVESVNPTTSQSSFIEEEVLFGNDVFSKTVTFTGVHNIEPFYVNLSLHPRKSPGGPSCLGPPTIVLPGIRTNRPQVVDMSGINDKTIIGTCNKDSGIELSIDQMPSNCVGIKIFREDIVDKRTRKIVLQRPLSGPERITHVDKTAAPGRIYIYSAELIMRTQQPAPGIAADYRFGHKQNQLSANSKIQYSAVSKAEAVVKRKLQKESRFRIVYDDQPPRIVDNALRIEFKIFEYDDPLSNDAVKALVASYDGIESLTKENVFSQEKLHNLPVPFVRVDRLDLATGSESVVGYSIPMGKKPSFVEDRSALKKPEATRYRYYMRLFLVNLGSLRDGSTKLLSRIVSGDRSVEINQKKYDIFSGDGKVESLEFTKATNNFIKIIERNDTGQEFYIDYEWQPPVRNSMNSSSTSDRNRPELQYIPRQWGADIVVRLKTTEGKSEFMLYKKTSMGRRVLVGVQRVSRNLTKYIVPDRFLSVGINETPDVYTIDIVTTSGILLKGAAFVTAKRGAVSSSSSSSKSGDAAVIYERFTSGRDTEQKHAQRLEVIDKNKKGEPDPKYDRSDLNKFLVQKDPPSKQVSTQKKNDQKAQENKLNNKEEKPKKGQNNGRLLVRARNRHRQGK